MKKKLLIVLCALLVGGVSAFYLFNKVVVKKDNDDGYVMAKAFQIGAFTKYDNAVRVADLHNGVVISDEAVYRVYVAVLNDPDAVLKLQKYYEEIGLNYYLKDVLVSSKFVKDIKISEEMLNKSSSDTYDTINGEILKIYREML